MTPEEREKEKLQSPIGNLGPRMLQVINAVRQAITLPGEIWECGVCRGVTSRWIAFQVSEYIEVFPKVLRLFDTFEGRPEKTEHDTGTSNTTFSDTSLEYVQRLVPWDFVKFHKGLIPLTFVGLEDTEIAFAYLDLDLYQSTKDALNFVLPRLVVDGIIIVDDFNTSVWDGVTKAIVEVMRDKIRFSMTNFVARTCVIRRLY